jgi:hypothetical protein
MKTIALNLLALFALAVPAVAAKPHGHHHEKKLAGPNGGRVITVVEPHLEFYVTKDRKVEITALTDDLKPAKLGGQVIAVTAGDRSKPTKIEFKEEGGRLLSTNTLPDGNDYPVVVSVKADANARAVYGRFYLNIVECPGCKHAEYACICAHTH